MALFNVSIKPAIYELKGRTPITEAVNHDVIRLDHEALWWCTRCGATKRTLEAMKEARCSVPAGGLYDRFPSTTYRESNPRLLELKTADFRLGDSWFDPEEGDLWVLAEVPWDDDYACQWISPIDLRYHSFTKPIPTRVDRDINPDVVVLTATNKLSYVEAVTGARDSTLREAQAENVRALSRRMRAEKMVKLTPFGHEIRSKPDVARGKIMDVRTRVTAIEVGTFL